MKRVVWLSLSIVLLAAPGRADEAAVVYPPLLYFADSPNHCYPIGGTEYFVYVAAPQDPDITGVSFDLYLTGAGAIPEPLVLPYGVIQYSVDTSSMPYHVTATWPPRNLNHAPVLQFVFPSDPQLGGLQVPSNVEFTTAGGTVPGIGRESWADCCIDCFNCFVSISADDHVLAAAGETTMIPFEWSWHCYTTGGFDLTVTDTEGWVSSWSPPSVGGGESCTVCVVPRGSGFVEVVVPSGTPLGATSTVIIGGRQVVVEADDVVSTEQTSWSRIKALYQ